MSRLLRTFPLGGTLQHNNHAMGDRFELSAAHCENECEGQNYQRGEKILSLDGRILVILSLIDFLHKSQREFRMLQQAIDEQPEDRRLEVLDRYISIRKL
ncbi:hypothetical protein [Roseovarius pacificus]|uniref:hypothetical protein n=1 Tax=Roseovarius pacificus TaxID=337701 RepID=UPI004038FC21